MNHLHHSTVETEQHNAQQSKVENVEQIEAEISRAKIAVSQ